MARGDPPNKLENLLPYASVALKGRLAAAGQVAAAREVTAYQEVVTEFREAIRETVKLRR
jgi:hypothetical protein